VAINVIEGTSNREEDIKANRGVCSADRGDKRMLREWTSTTSQIGRSCQQAITFHDMIDGG